MKPISFILLYEIVLITVAYSQMPPISLTAEDLPYKTEGYTVIIDGDKSSLYQEYSNLPLRNIYNNGGIQIEFDIIGVSTDEKFLWEVDREYELKIKISKGREFERRTRMISDLKGPLSHVIIHIPKPIEITSNPTINIDGRTVSQEMIHILFSVASLGVPAIGPIGSMLANMVIDAILEAIGHRIIHESFKKYKPSERIEIFNNINFEHNQDIQQITWQLGGWDFRDHLTINTAEIVLPITFREKGKNDLSFFFNIWGTHTYSDIKNPITGTVRGVLHLFRQHIVLRVNPEMNYDKYYSSNLVLSPCNINPFDPQTLLCGLIIDGKSMNVVLGYDKENYDMQLSVFNHRLTWKDGDTIENNMLGIGRSLKVRKRKNIYRIVGSWASNMGGVGQINIIGEPYYFAHITGMGIDSDVIKTLVESLPLEQLFQQYENHFGRK